MSELARGPYLCPRYLPVGNGVVQVSDLVVDQRGELLPQHPRRMCCVAPDATRSLRDDDTAARGVG